MGMLSSFFHPGRAYKKANEQATNYYNQGQSYLQPYQQQGQQAYEPLFGAMQKLLNPQELYDEWSQGYEQSPAATMAMERAKNQGMDTASSLGMLHSSPALRAIQAGTSEIGAQDQMEHFKRLLDLYTHGANIGQNIYGQGANAAGAMGQNAMNMGQNAAQMAYGEQSAPGSLLGSLLGAGVGLAGSALGGPIGGALANKFIGPWTTMGGK